MKGREIIKAFEQSESILTCKLPALDLPLWPFVRYIFLNLYSARINNLSSTVSRADKAKSADLLKSLIISSFRNPYFMGSNKVLFFNSAVTNVKLENGKFFNRVTDYFYFQIPGQAVLIEDLLKFKIVQPRVHNDVYSFLPLKLKAVSRFYMQKAGYSKGIQAEIKQLISYLASIAPRPVDDDFWQECSAVFSKQVSKIQAEYETYLHFLILKKPKLLFLEDATYGSKLPLLLASKKLNIPVAELQHGLINENHLAYQFGEGVLGKFLPYLPDYFLSYADYWSDAVNLPSQKIKIGNPFLQEYLQKYPKRTETKVLILGTGTSKDQLITFCKHLRDNPFFIDHQFVLRPHPWERDVAAEKYSELLQLGFVIDFANLYESLSTSAVVFGEMSTAIFEATVYNIPIYLIATEHCRTYVTESTPFPVIEINEEVSIRDFRALQNSSSVNLWAEDWDKNFQQFMSNFIDV